jgi:C1A family cysteine protease
VGYQRLDSSNLNQLKGCIASGYPFVFGFTVYDAFESQEVAKTGVLNMPGPKEKVQGGHAVLAVGYDDAAQRFTVRNSWGKDWGIKGYFTIPYSYLTTTDLADDFWTIRILKES